MLNLIEAFRSNPSYNRLEIGEFLFVEYTCGTDDEKVPLWAETDHLMHVVTGRKTWHTVDGPCVASPGETLFVKKGATIWEQHFEAETCLLTFFVPDALVRSTVREMGGSSTIKANKVEPIKSASHVKNDVGLAAFFQSMRTYFSGREKPSEPLVRLKFKELIISVLTSGKNPALAAYFQEIGASEAPSVKEIMEANFRFNLSLDEYARLCHRSRSSFKRDFQEHFKESPGKWLLQKRIDHSAALLRNSKLNVTEIAFESGFEDVSHFSRVFKERFHVPPLTYRESLPTAG